MSTTFELTNASRIGTTTVSFPQFGASIDLVSANSYIIYTSAILAVKVVMCLVGMCTNVINIRAFYRIGLEDSVTIVFFFIAISDFLLMVTMVVGAGSTIAWMVDTRPSSISFPPIIVANIISMVTRVFSEITYLSTTFLALQRCLCVVKPLTFKGMFTRSGTFAIIGVIWLFWLSFNIVFVVYNADVKKIFSPLTNTSIYIMMLRPGREQVNDALNAVSTFFFTPVYQVLTIVCISIMANALRKSVEFRKMATATASDTTTLKEQPNNKTSSSLMANTKERQAIIQVSLVTGIFVCCNTLRMAMAIGALVEPRFDFMRPYHYTFLVCYQVFVTFEQTNASVNFFIYHKYNTKFRSVCFASNK